MLDIFSVKKKPKSVLYIVLGFIIKGNIIEVNDSELGLDTEGGKVVWNNNEKDDILFLIFCFFKIIFL